MPELIFSVLYNEIILVWCFQPYCLQYRNAHAYSRDAADAWTMGRETAGICECACAASAQDFTCTSLGWGGLPTHPTRGWVVLGPHNKVRHYFISAFLLLVCFGNCMFGHLRTPLLPNIIRFSFLCLFDVTPSFHVITNLKEKLL